MSEQHARQALLLFVTLNVERAIILLAGALRVTAGTRLSRE